MFNNKFCKYYIDYELERHEYEKELTADQQQILKKGRAFKLIFITIFFGVFGIHKFITKNTLWGIIYLFTGGFMGIAWIIDIFIALSEYKSLY